MKPYCTILIIAFSFLISCSVGDDIPQNSNEVRITWHLKQTTGGVAGINDEFAIDDVVWSFSEDEGTLNVDNQNTDTEKQDFLDSGTYSFSIATINGENFISIGGVEYGEIIIGNTQFTINENYTSVGEIADGFIYTFQRVTEQI